MGSSIKYVTLFLIIFYPLPLSHFVTHLGIPSTVRHILELTNPKDFSDSLCASELCKVHSI